MSQKNIPLLFTGGLIMGSCLVFWNDMIDASLVPRIFFASVWLLAFSPFLYKLFKNEPIELGLPDALFIGYLLLHGISILQAINKPEAVYETLKIFIAFCAYMAFKTVLLKKLVSESNVLKVLIPVCLAYFTYACIQLWTLSYSAKLEGDNLYAVTGLSGHKNLYSGLMLITSFLLGVLAINTKGVWRTLALLVIMLQAVMIFVLQTRSVFMGIVVAMFILGVGSFMMGRQALVLIKKIALPAIGVIAAVILFFVFSGTLSSMLQRLNVASYLHSDTSIERLTVWYKSSLMLKDHWLLGVGARNWMLVYPYYSLSGMFRPQYLNTVFLEPHNDFLWVWCELGILGLMTFIAIFGSYFYILIKGLLNNVKQGSERFVPLILFAQQIAFIIFCFFDFPKERIEHQILLVLSWAIISARYGNYAKTFKLPPKLTQPVLYVSFVLIIGTVIFMGARLQGEYYVRPMLAAEQKGDSKSMLEYARIANNPFSNLTPLSVPKKWYEGIACYGLGDNEGAYNCFAEAKKQSPYNHNTLNNLGGMETLFKRYDKAFENYNEALRINPRNDDTRFNIAYTLLIMQRYPEALDTLNNIRTNLDKKQAFINAVKDAQQKSTLKNP
jgi:O-antigen ligase